MGLRRYLGESRYSLLRRGILVVWLTLWLAPWSHTSPIANYAEGAGIFIQRCALCHGHNGMGKGLMPLKIPDYPDTSIVNSGMFNTKDELVKAVSEGLPASVLGKFMPPWKDELTKKEILAVADFVMYLRRDIEGATKVLNNTSVDRVVHKGQGKILFEYNCSLCHGKSGKGDGRMRKIINNPPPANLIASVTKSEYMKIIIQQGGQKVGRSPQMPPWKEELTDNEIDAIIRYILDKRESTKSPKTSFIDKQ